MAARTPITINRKGGCTCGAVEFEVNGPMHYSALCHCRSCSYSRATSPVHCMGIARADLKFTKGEDKIKSQRKAEGLPNHHWCGECGTNFGNKVDSMGAWGLDAAFQLVGMLEKYLTAKVRHQLRVAAVVVQDRQWVR